MATRSVTPKPKRARFPRRQWQSLTPRGKKVVLFVLGGFGVLFLIVCSWIYRAARIPLPDDPSLAQTSFVLYEDGAEVGRLAGENRIDVPLDSLSMETRRAVLAAEDKDFYDHGAISFRALLRAAWADVRGGGVKQGGSTITQQYAKNAYLSHDRTVARKVREAVVAFKMGRKYSKDTILGFYINTVYYGRGAFGIEAAAKAYFGVPAAKLTVEQAAVLAALIRAPESGDPERAPERAQSRWRNVLKTMAEKDWIDDGLADAAQYPKVRPRSESSASNNLSGAKGYILQMVQEELEANGFDPKEILTGGYRIETTLRRTMQDAAVRAVDEVLDDPENDPQAALVAVEPGTGRIRAMYGGRDYLVRQFNNALDGNGRQPGSSFKPYVLAAALKNGTSLRSRYDGHSPQDFPGYEDVTNFGDEQFGQVDLVQATARSVNTVYVKLGLDTGVRKVVEAAHDAGIAHEDEPLRTKVDLRADGSIALGSSEVHPIDQAVGFSTFAAAGQATRPYVVSRVLRGKEVVYKGTIKKHQAFSAEVAADVTFAMQQVVTSGTGGAARVPGRPVAGKTGSTSDNRDAWFVGFTPQVSAAVWLGFDPPKALRGVQGVAQVTGGSLPARIWQRFMAAAHEGLPVEQFPPPAYVGSATNAAPSETSASPSPSVTSLTPSPSISDLPLPSESGEPTDSPDPEPTDPEPSESPSDKPDKTKTPGPEPAPSTSG